jgi:hypothetical protein
LVKTAGNGKIQWTLILLFSLFPAVISAGEADPERIVLNLTTDPTSEIAITWKTGTGIENPRVEYMLASSQSTCSNGGGTGIYKKVKRAEAVTQRIETGKETTVFFHSVILKNLEPGTSYQYRVGSGNAWSEWCFFKTADIEEKPFTFIYLGDPQDDLKSFCPRVFRAAYSAAPQSRFMIITGDLVSYPWRDKWWKDFFYAAGWMVRYIPIVVVPGNHAYSRSNGLWRFSAKSPHPLWYAHFTLPRNGPQGFDETVYYFDYQGARFIQLNGNEGLEAQAAWLETVLTHNPNRWTFVTIHQPFYSTGQEYRDNPKLRKIFLPLIDKYGVDLVLQGHDHTYGRTYKLKNGAIVKDDEPGTVFVSSVSGPKFYTLNPKHRHLMKKMGTDVQLFQVIEVNKNILTFEARTAAGERFDFFTLTKL